MIETSSMNPAEQAAKKALAAIYTCIDEEKSFLLEAGAGAGKTYSLIQALNYLINKQGKKLIRQHQQVACITYTNVATDEIKSRTDEHPAILASTIHAFCWSLIKDFQPFLRNTLPTINRWPERLEEAGGIGLQKISYEFGYPRINDAEFLLHHDDVLSLTVALMEQVKFRKIFSARFPILFIDEYQDTNKEFANALITHFLAENDGPLIGLFGDHWQKIYGDGCGKIEHVALEVIGHGANFRSVKTIVDVLNQIRPELPQTEKDPNSKGFVAVYHTNSWAGERRTGSHWAGDLPSEISHSYLEVLKNNLAQQGWDFSPEETKILMLTHKVLAMEQGYSGIESIFSEYREGFTKKEDPVIEFFVDTLEPVCIAYENQRYGDMFAALGSYTPAIHTHLDKGYWRKAMDKLLELRKFGTIGEVIDHLQQNKRPRLPYIIDERLRELESEEDSASKSSSIKRLRDLKNISYQEIIVLAQFLDEHTLFSTKHGVKGAEFENVLVVVGRGWNQYNFNQMLEWFSMGVPSDKQDTFERNRNLFYVACSRPKTRLALLFTQKLSPTAISTLSNWFGEESIHSL